MIRVSKTFGTGVSRIVAQVPQGRCKYIPVSSMSPSMATKPCSTCTPMLLQAPCNLQNAHNYFMLHLGIAAQATAHKKALFRGLSFYLNPSHKACASATSSVPS